MLGTPYPPQTLQNPYEAPVWTDLWKNASGIYLVNEKAGVTL
jgi:hypothetical protein